jgi:hypothetical protein
MSNFSFARPTELAPQQERETIAGECPGCGAAALKRYPVLSEGGWFLVTKCQDCLHSVNREPWALLGHVKLRTDDII